MFLRFRSFWATALAVFLFCSSAPHSYAISSYPDGWTTYGVPSTSVDAFALHSDGRTFIGGSVDYVGTTTSYGGVNRWGRTSSIYDASYSNSSAYGIDVISDGNGGTFWGHNGLSLNGDPIGGLLHITAGGVADDLGFAWTGGFVTDLFLDGDILYVGGTFTAVNGTTRNRLAAIDTTDNSLTAWDPVLNGTANKIRVTTDYVYVTGSQTCVGGDGDGTCGEAGETTSYRLSRFNKTTGAVDATWAPVLNGTGQSLALNPDDNLIYVGGSFTCVGGDGDATCGEAGESSREDLAAFYTNDAGTIHSFNPIASGTVYGLELDETSNYLYVGGGFGCFGGDGDATCGEASEVTRNRLARFDTVDHSLMAWDPSPISSGSILAIYLYGTEVFYGFTGFGAVSKVDGSATWAPAETWVGTYYPQALFVNNDYVYVGSQAQIVEPEYVRTALFSLEADGSITAWDPNVTGGDVTEMALDEAQNLLYIAGTFTAVGGVTRNRLAAVDIDTGVVTDWDPNVNGTINSIVLDAENDLIYIGGTFTTVNGATTRNRLAAISTTTGTATSWNPVAGGSSLVVYALVQSGATIYAGGSFTCVGGDGDGTCGEAGESTRNRIAAFSTSGSGAVTTWNPSATSGQVSAMVLDGTTLYVGGTFTNIGGAARNRLAALDTLTDTTNALTWNPSSTAEPSALALDAVQDYLYVGLSSASVTIGGGTRSYFARLDLTTDTSNITSWDPVSTGAVKALLFSDNQLYVGGNGFIRAFGSSEEYVRFNLARFSSLVQFASATASGGESTASPAVTVTLGAADTETITVDYAVTGGTATGTGTDYTLASGTLTFTPGDTSETIPLSVVDDGEADGNETVVITLSNPTNGSLGTASVFTYTITDNDAAAGGGSGSSSAYTPPAPIFANVVTLQSPNGGEVFVPGSAHRITWNVPSGRADFVDIAWSADGGATWQEIVRGLPNQGGYDWTVPVLSRAVTSGLIRVSLTDLAAVFATDLSDNTFSIWSPPTPPPALPISLELLGLAWGGVTRSPDASGVYFLDPETGTRRPFLDAQTYYTYFGSFAPVRAAPDTALASLPIGAPMLPKPGTVFVKLQSDPVVYMLEVNPLDPTRPIARPIPDEHTAERLAGPSWADYIIDLPVTVFPRLSIGPSVDEKTPSFQIGSLFTRLSLNR